MRFFPFAGSYAMRKRIVVSAIVLFTVAAIGFGIGFRSEMNRRAAQETHAFNDSFTIGFRQ